MFDVRQVMVMDSCCLVFHYMGFIVCLKRGYGFGWNVNIFVGFVVSLGMLAWLVFAGSVWFSIVWKFFVCLKRGYGFGWNVNIFVGFAVSLGMLALLVFASSVGD